MAYGRYDAAVIPDGRCELLEILGVGIVDQRGVAGTSEEDAIVVRSERGCFVEFIEFGAELGRMVFPDLLVFRVQPIFSCRQPVGRIRARLGREVDLEPCLPENFEWVERFGDEETRLLPVLVQRSVGGGNGNNYASGGRWHCG